jgi:hypothetical protein
LRKELNRKDRKGGAKEKGLYGDATSGSVPMQSLFSWGETVRRLFFVQFRALRTSVVNPSKAYIAFAGCREAVGALGKN